MSRGTFVRRPPTSIIAAIVIRATTLSGTVELGERAVERLRGRLSGALVLPGNPAYDGARIVWNRMIDKRPALIARCAGADDVVVALDFAREHDLLISVRGGGHNVTGNAVCDDGLMLDLSLMKGARVDAQRRIVVAEPGLTWKEFDTATQRHDLATTGGIVSSTGVPASPRRRPRLLMRSTADVRQPTAVEWSPRRTALRAALTRTTSSSGRPGRRRNSAS